MRKKAKKLITLFIIGVVFQALKYNTVFAAENLSSKTYLTGVSVDKIWKVSFSEELDADSIKNNVKVIDKETNKEVKSILELEEDNKTLKISSKYSKDKNYTLTLNKNIKSKTNKYLNQTTSKDFTTNKETNTITVITTIENINVVIEQNAIFDLPSTVNAVMNDGKVKKVDVKWDKPLKTTQTPGKYTFYGTVSGYEKKVQFDLTINTRKNSEVKPNESIKDTGENKEVEENKDNFEETHAVLHKDLYNYLMNEENRQSVMNRAVELHGGDLRNNCVYFASEGLRRAGLSELPEYVCNTVQLTNKLKAMGWETSKDFSKIRPGDICFTKSYGNGPTHTYVFMKWVDPEKYDYAYICDNQGNEYGGIYHKRNVNFATKTKDPTVYFMYKLQDK